MAQLEDNPDIGNRVTYRWADDPEAAVGKWGVEWVGVVWCGVEQEYRGGWAPGQDKKTVED